MKLRQIIATTVLSTSLTSCHILVTGFENNKIINQDVMRSAQVTPARLDKYREKMDLQTVINLRGESQGSDWYDAESAYCDANDITLLNVKSRASRFPKKEEILNILDALEKAERPFLMHCKGGADRTGLAATIYYHLHKNMPIKQATRKGCTVTNGNLIPYQRAFFNMYEPFEEKMDFKTWVQDVYVQPPKN